MVKQCVDATYQDIRKRELLAELHLRVIEVQCSAPVMWIAPSKRISQGFQMVISRDPCPTTTSPVIMANEDTSPDQTSRLSLCVSRAPHLEMLCHCAYILCPQGDRPLRMRIQKTRISRNNINQRTKTQTIHLSFTGTRYNWFCWLRFQRLTKVVSKLCSILLVVSLPLCSLIHTSLIALLTVSSLSQSV